MAVMTPLLSFAKVVDRMNDAVYGVVRWLTLAMVLAGAYNAVARYLTKYVGVTLASNALIDLQWYMFSLIFLLGAAYGLNRDVHVRVDVLYSKVSDRTRIWIDLVGTLVFLIPFCLMMLATCWPAVRNSWAVREGSPDPGGLARYPVKTVLLICFSLLLVQALSHLFKNIARLTGALPLTPVADNARGDFPVERPR